MTSCISVRGLLVKIKEGSRLVRMVAARAFASVPETFVRGRRITSNIAFEGNSDASLTSIGPEMEASAAVSPSNKSDFRIHDLRGKECMKKVFTKAKSCRAVRPR